MRCTSLILLLVLLISSCDEEIDIYAKFEPKPVIHCVLNLEQDIQFLRLTWTVDPRKTDSNIEMTNIQETQISLEAVKNGNVVEVKSFREVDNRRYSIHFPHFEARLFQTEMRVVSDTEYRLILFSPGNDILVYSSCQTVGLISILNPVYPEVRELNMQVNHNPVFTFTQSRNAGIYQIGYILNYLETDMEETSVDSVILMMNTIQGAEVEDFKFNQSINSNQFYIRIASALESKQDV